MYSYTLAIVLWMTLGAGLLRASAFSPQFDSKHGHAIYLVDPNEQLAADQLAKASIHDLANYLGRVYGVTFDVKAIKELPAKALPGIYLGLGVSLQQLGAADGLRPQEYQIVTDSQQMLLVGGDARGLSHAIYTLLELLGCRWYFPGDLWAILPEHPMTSISFNERRMPSYELQRRMWLGWGAGSQVIRTEFPDWQRRNRMAEPYDMQTSHSWLGLTNEQRMALFAKQPELFGLDRGDRKPKKLCYAHPQVIQMGIDYALKYFHDNPDKKMVSLTPPDGAGYCGCELTLNMANVEKAEERKPYRNLFGTQPDGTHVSVTSEEVFHFVNSVARAVDQAFPGKRVGVLAYTSYAHPPSFNFEPNVYVEVTSGYRFTPMSEQEQIESFATRAKWLGIYQYYDVEQWSFERPGRRPSNFDKIELLQKQYYQAGIRSATGEMSNNFAPYGLGYYITSQLHWDVEQNASDLISRFYQEAFGPAAEPVKRVIDRWSSEKWSWDKQVPITMIRATYHDLQQAAELAKDSLVFRDRVDRLRMYAIFLNRYMPMRIGKIDADIELWKERYGQPQLARRVQEFAQWSRDLMNTHMVHSYAFNKYLAERGNALSLDTRLWRQPGTIPTHEQVQIIFSKDIAAWQNLEQEERQ